MMRYSISLKKVLMLVLLFCSFSAGLAHAFLFEITPIDRAAIQKLTDENLIDAYINVMIELEAVNSFYNNAGFKPKEYEQYKALLRFRTDLLMEMQRRGIEAPKIK